MSLDDQPDLDPVLADTVRRAYVRPVDEETARRHVSAMAATATGAAAETAPVLRRPGRRRVVRSAVAAGVATLLLPAGLAVAGVSLPNIVERPYRAVGITLPHQTDHETFAPEPAGRPLAPTTTPDRRRPVHPRAPHQPAGVNRPQPGKRQEHPFGLAGRAGRSPGASALSGSRLSPHLKQGKVHKPKRSWSPREHARAARRASGANEPSATARTPNRGGG